MFKAKVIKAHHERRGTVEDHSNPDQESDHSASQVTSEQVQVNSSSNLPDEDSRLLHSVHAEFLKRQIKESVTYHQTVKELPQTVSSKRKLDVSLTEIGSIPLTKSCKASGESSPSGSSKSLKGQRTVSIQEKNRRRKEKKKRAKERSL